MIQKLFSAPSPVKTDSFSNLRMVVKTASVAVACLGVIRSFPYFFSAWAIWEGYQVFENWQTMSLWEKEHLSPEPLFRNAPLLKILGPLALKVYQLATSLFTQYERNLSSLA